MYIGLRVLVILVGL